MFLFNGWWRITFLLTIIVQLFVRCDGTIRLKGLEADTWGYEFIFVLPPNNNDVTQTQAGMHIIAMDTLGNYSVDIEYNEISGTGSNMKLDRKNDTVFVQHFKEYNFTNVILNDIKDGLHKMADARIHVTSKTKISIIAYTIDSSDALDYFMVYPVGMGSNYYAFSLPAPTADGTISLFFLPLGGSNATISQNSDVHNITINVSRQNKMTTLVERMEAGSLWQYTVSGAEPISVWISDELDDSNFVRKTVRPRHRHHKFRSSTPQPNTRVTRLLIIASIRKLSGSKTVDYGCHMPTPMIVDQCALLTTPDYHPMHTFFGKNQYITAPTPHCPPDPVLVNTSITSSRAISIKWDETGKLSRIDDQSSSKTFIVSSSTTIMNILRISDTAEGAYIHEIPAYSQWVNGDVPIVVPEGTAQVLILADDYGREAVFENLEYPIFETIQDVSSDIGLYMVSKDLKIGTYRLGIDQDLGGRLIVLVQGNTSTKHSYGYVASINPHKIPPPIFVQPSTTTGNWTTTESTSTTTPVVVTTTTTVTTTRGTSLAALSTNLFAICIYFMVFDDNEQRTVIL